MAAPRQDTFEGAFRQYPCRQASSIQPIEKLITPHDLRKACDALFKALLSNHTSDVATYLT